MPRNVTIASGKKGVVLPNGHAYNAGDTALLTDDQYAILSSDFKAAFFSTDVFVPTDETTRAQTAESTNTSAIASETTRAETAETGEVTRATTAEAAKAATTALTAETTRATTAESAVATSVSTETTRAEAAEAAAEITVYTLSTLPSATGSGKVIFVSDDGPGTLYKDTASDTWTPLNPGEIAYVANVTGTVTTSNTVEVDVPGCSITIPKSNRPVWIEAYAWAQQTALGGGLGVLSLYETTSGTTFITNFGGPVPNSTGSGSAFFTIKGSHRLGTTTGTRTFKIRTSITRDTASTATANLLNNSVSGFFTWLRAYAQ